MLITQKIIETQISLNKPIFATANECLTSTFFQKKSFQYSKSSASKKEKRWIDPSEKDRKHRQQSLESIA